MKVVVIGAGIVGCSVASELSQAGHQVQLIDKGRIGYGCSYGNAGWMTPCFAMPLAMPGMLWKSIRWLLNPNSPLYIHPKPSLLLAQWMWRFMGAMNVKQANRSIHALVQLSQTSLIAYEELAKRHPLGFERKGLLMLCQTSKGLRSAIHEMNLVAPLGVPGRVLTAGDVRDLEPAVKGAIEGAVYFPNEAHAEPLAVVRALAAEAKKHNCEITEDCELLSADFDAKKIRRLHTTRGTFEADAFVLAAGTWSTALARMLKINVPILGGKGYALIVPPLATQPKIPMMLLEKKIAITPRPDSLRIAGTLELVNQDFSITDRRVQNIIKGSREFLELPKDLKVKELWRGLRPCTPDGVPLIGFHPRLENLMLACGHQMLGLQSGLGTGILVKDLFSGKALSGNDQVFTPGRFE